MTTMWVWTVNEQMNVIVVQGMHCIMIYAECVNFPGISLFGPFSVHVDKMYIVKQYQRK